MFRFLNFKSQNKGLTLIELLVVLAIVTIISLMVLPRFRVVGQYYVLLRSTHRIAQDLRRVKEMTTSGYEFQNRIPRGGYGIYFSLADNYYILFADFNDDQRFTEAEGEQIEKIELDERIEIKQLSPASPLNVVFKYPDPLVFISGEDNIAKITLKLKIDPERTKTIEVNTVGMIDIN